jgi:UDP-N-acetylmuramate--alanine ligase
LGGSGLLVTEACEYVESFLELSPTRIIINNIDDDHLDCYRDIEHIETTFLKFIKMLPKEGELYVCADDPRALRVADQSGLDYTAYGLTAADYTAADVRANEFGHVSFDCVIRGKTLGRVALGVVGMHNVQNALAAITILCAIGVEFGEIAKGLSEYKLTKRRFEYYGEKNGVRVFHDYAHHPSEIRACLAAAKMTPHKRVFAVFQCNSYTRAKTLFLEPGDCFCDADEVLVPDIYPGRETDKGEVHARDMVRGIEAEGSNAKYLATFEEIRAYLLENARQGDIVVTLGSGDVNNRSRIFVE